MTIEFFNCVKCGTKLELSYPDMTGFKEHEEYYCPKCNHEYFVMTSGIPSVRVVEENSNEA